jgi:hypothetical protein
MLYITTPCSRPDNLLAMSKSIPTFATWVVIHEPSIELPKIDNMISIECPKTGFVGADGRNYFLDNFNLTENDWIYSLDDDNIIHPDFHHIEGLLGKDFSLIYWGQLNKDNTIRLQPLNEIILNTIDAACFVSNMKYNRHLRYDTNAYNYDGLYAIECSKNGDRLKLDNYLAYYNYLR